MSRKLLSLAMLVAVCAVTLGASDAEARRCCRAQHRQRCCHTRSHGCHNQGYANQGYANCGQFSGGCQQANYIPQQPANFGCQPTHQVAMNAGCGPRATCCSAQTACAVSVMPATFTGPQAPLQLAPEPAPAPNL